MGNEEGKIRGSTVVDGLEGYTKTFGLDVRVQRQPGERRDEWCLMVREERCLSDRYPPHPNHPIRRHPWSLSQQDSRPTILTDNFILFLMFWEVKLPKSYAFLKS